MEAFLSCTPEDYIQNESAYNLLLKDEKTWREIPLINYTNLQDLTDYSLVRFRGLIQDMLDPEFYLEKYKLTSEINGVPRIQNGKYRDCLVMKPEETIAQDDSENIRNERRTVFVVSIPGLNDWAIDFEKSSTKTVNTAFDESGNSKLQKRSIEEVNENAMDVDPLPNYQDPSKKKRITNNHLSDKTSEEIGLTPEFLINSPISERPGKSCLLKIYTDFEDHSLNEVIDVVGFLSVNPILDGANTQLSEFDDLKEVQANDPPPSLIPRIHAIAIRKLNHLNPLLDQHISDKMISLQQKLNFDTIHSDMKNILTQCLFGDEFAANYLLAHLISSVYVRNEVDSVGHFSVNFCNIPSLDIAPDYTKKLYEIIELLLPASHYLPLTLENMNTKKFVPEKNYETNKLISGLLQLAPHTHLILDETHMQTGKLESNGIMAVKNLAHLISSQEVSYNFKFYELKFNVDIPVMILSEGRSMIPINIQVPVQVSPDSLKFIDETLTAAKHFLKLKLNDIRMYLTTARIQTFSISPENQEMIENDFVGMRKESSKVNAELLHTILIFSRLLAIAKGKDVLDKDSWDFAKGLETQRKLRLDNMRKNNVSKK